MVVDAGESARKFGAEIRRLRLQSGYSQQQLADMIPISQSTISSAELGRVKVKKDLAGRIDELLTASGRLMATWEAQYSAYEPPDWYRKVPAMERRATEIQDYQPLLVPGLLQTEDYARASIQAGNRRAAVDHVEALVTARMERQQILRCRNPPFFLAVLDDTVLRRRMGGSETMARQLEQLREVSTWERVELLVVPADTLGHPGLDGGFRLLKVPDAGTVLYEEVRATGGVVIDPVLVDEHVSLMGDLRGVALPPDQSRALIEKARGEIE
ncbi:helix-turn-helix domain-containing protein [Marinactinospora rubrisoli]|uniref:Scr1 family TA system antitoxin-like transcriptional regulator n=1 Tax=Marinactinospora rubrisoli TaxID=2715399 RepID=A0ABW2KGC2_9ACTN